MADIKSFPDEIYEWRVNWYKEKKRTRHPSDEASETSNRVNALVHGKKLQLRFPDDFIPENGLPINLFDKKFEFDSITNTVTLRGIGGSVVLDETVCMIDFTRYFLSYILEESCGECTLCRVGSRRMFEIMERICTGHGNPDDIDTLEELADKIAVSSKCEVGKKAANSVLCTVKNFIKDYKDHILNHRCRTGKCNFKLES